MKRLLCLLAVAAAPLLAEQWPVSDAQLGAPRGRRDHPRIAAGANGFPAGGDVVGWTLRVGGGLQLQWRGGGDAAGPAGGGAGVAGEPRLAGPGASPPATAGNALSPG